MTQGPVSLAFHAHRPLAQRKYTPFQFLYLSSRKDTRRAIGQFPAILFLLRSLDMTFYRPRWFTGQLSSLQKQAIRENNPFCEHTH